MNGNPPTRRPSHTPLDTSRGSTARLGASPGLGEAISLIHQLEKKVLLSVEQQKAVLDENNALRTTVHHLENDVQELRVSQAHLGQQFLLFCEAVKQQFWYIQSQSPLPSSPPPTYAAQSTVRSPPAVQSPSSCLSINGYTQGTPYPPPQIPPPPNQNAFATSEDYHRYAATAQTRRCNEAISVGPPRAELNEAYMAWPSLLPPRDPSWSLPVPGHDAMRVAGLASPSTSEDDACTPQKVYPVAPNGMTYPARSPHSSPPS